MFVFFGESGEWHGYDDEIQEDGTYFFGYNAEYGATRRTVTNRVKRLAAETDLRKKITPHLLRHTYGTLIAARGATPQYIRRTMGHADLSGANDYLQ
ncbi:tyrosine-type recombinase/integrase [Halobaculum sp. P14]|uniref:tyrosine-type recombinase/integrase n=1 Tax=Halobaculum sp. P14 TaxID=3421638 RepID=UPI003EB94371